MVERPVCETCVHWNSSPFGEFYPDAGECRRLPPQFVASMIVRPQSPARLSDGERMNATMYPVTLSDDVGCGEHSGFHAYLESLQQAKQ